MLDRDFDVCGDYRFKSHKALKKLDESVKILSKYKNGESKTIYLSKFLIFSRIMTTLETGEFLFINVHLEFWSKYFRNKELKRLYNYIYSNKNKNIILVGDFNVKRSDKCFGKFVSKLEKIDIRLVDNKENTYQENVLDYIFVSNNYDIVDVWVEESFKTLSDHNPLFVKLRKK